MSENEVYVETCNVEQNEVLSGIFAHLNSHCFGGQLDSQIVMLTFSRTSRIIGGHFAPARWISAEDEETKIHEIALNANIMQQMSLAEFLKVLVHEMVHFWQWEHGTPGRQGYHTKEWGEKMLEVGITPINAMTGEPSTSGQSMGNGDFTEGSKLEKALKSMPDDLMLPWTAEPEPEQGKKNKQQGQGKRRGGTRSKYVCPSCGLAMWGKPYAQILCVQCNERFIESED